MPIKSTHIEFHKLSNSPETPDAGKIRMYAKQDGNIYSLDSSGNEFPSTGGVSELTELSDIADDSVNDGDYLEYQNGEWRTVPFPIIINDTSNFPDVIDRVYEHAYYEREESQEIFYLQPARPATLYRGTTTIPSNQTQASDYVLFPDDGNATQKAGDLSLKRSGAPASGLLTGFSTDPSAVYSGPTDRLKSFDVSYTMAGSIKVKNTTNVGQVFVTPVDWFSWPDTPSNRLNALLYFTDSGLYNFPDALNDVQDKVYNLNFVRWYDNLWAYPRFTVSPPSAPNGGYTFAIINRTNGSVEVEWTIVWKIARSNR